MYPSSNSGGYTYTNAGFNGFLRRTIASDPNAMTLNQMRRSTVGSNSLNFDQLQVSGNLGDIIEVGKIKINGVLTRLEFNDDNNEIIGIVGNIDE